MLLSESSGRDKGRTYCNKKQIIICHRRFESESGFIIKTNHQLIAC
jgi:hypothetical protein